MLWFNEGLAPRSQAFFDAVLAVLGTTVSILF